MTTDLATFLFEQTRRHIGDGRIVSITPNSTDALDSGVVNRIFDSVILQSYDSRSVLESIKNFLRKLDIDKSKFYCGICSEPDGQWWPNGVVGDIGPWKAAMEYYRSELAGFYNWRIDNDDPLPLGNGYGVPRYTITSQMWEYFHGEAPRPPLYP